MLSIDDNRLAGAGTSLPQIVAASLVCLLAAACTETPTQPRDTTLPTGRWTGDGAACLWQLTAAILSSAAATVSLRNLTFTLTAPSRRAAPIVSRRDLSASIRRRRRRFRAS